MVLRFIQRRSGIVNELRRFRRIESAEPFCDVSRRGASRICQLISKLEVLRCGSRLKQLVYPFAKLEGKLPTHEFAEVMSHAANPKHAECQNPNPRLEPSC